MRAAVRLGHSAVTGGHLLLGLLDGGHGRLLPDGVDALDLRRETVERLGPATAGAGEVAERLDRLAAWLRPTDPEAAAEIEDIADLHRAGLDRLVQMVWAWRGEIFLDAVAKDETVARLLGPRRPAPKLDERLLDKYLADIARYPALAPAEEGELSAAAAAGDETARRRLVQANLRLVVDLARTYEGPGRRLLDLIQEGNLGLLTAVERYDPAEGDFAAFATRWIRDSLTRALG